MANDLDYFMDLDPLELASTEGGIDAMILIMRQRRTMSQAGIKPKKETGPKVKLDLASLGIGKAPSAEPIKRRL